MRAVTVPAIALDDVHKRYGARQVLRGITLAIAAGQSVALVGLNGAGKTTLLRCLLDFQRADRGQLRIDGVAAAQAQARSRLTFLPERFQAPPFLTGREFLRLSADLHAQDWHADQAEAQCLALALAPGDLDKPVARLSKGSSQKLGLAACLLSRKALYILDEPLSGLDVQARALAIGQLNGLRAAGCTLFFTCHEPADIDVLCDRMVLLHDGQLHFDGSTMALKARFSSSSLEQSVLECLAAPPGVPADPVSGLSP